MSLRFESKDGARAIAEANAAALSGAPLGEVATDGGASLRMAMLRLAANRLCPCQRSDLIAATITSLREILPAQAASAALVDADIDSLLGSGDLLTGRVVVESGARLMIYQAPLMYVRRASGAVFLVGGGSPETSAPFRESIRAAGPFREILPPPSDLDLEAEGIPPFPMDAWIESPGPVSADVYIHQLDELLSSKGQSGDAGDFEVFDPDSQPHYYLGRWNAPKRRSGRFLARRQRKWGGRTWGYAELVNGESVKWLNLPALDHRFRACDEAWRAMCAFDRLAGKPQVLTVESVQGRTRLGMAMPIPMWGERRLLVSGRFVEGGVAGSMIAFDLQPEDAEEEVAFLENRLWLEPRRGR
jgi:hypothetical protein